MTAASDILVDGRRVGRVYYLAAYEADDPNSGWWFRGEQIPLVAGPYRDKATAALEGYRALVGGEL